MIGDDLSHLDDLPTVEERTRPRYGTSPQVGTTMRWHSWWDEPAPKDREVLVCVPGSTDHWHLVFWSDEDEYWSDVERGEDAFRGELLERCYLLPMWTEVEHSPSSLCKDSILNTHPKAYRP